MSLPPAIARRLVDRALFESEHVAVGVWRCPLDYPGFSDTGPVEGHLVVFPRTSVWIEPAGRERFVADPALATAYNQGQEYKRYPISLQGDHGDWWRVSPGLALEIASTYDASAVECHERPFQPAWAPVEPALFLRQRRMLRRIRAGSVDNLEIEEEVVSIIGAVIRSASVSRSCARCHPRRGAGEQRDLAEAARELIARDPASRDSLSQIADVLGASPFRLCRAFRAVTGTTLHAFRLDLRLRAALERLHERDLARVALDLGFAHHSHFTAAFRRHFGSPPSALRGHVGSSSRAPVP